MNLSLRIAALGVSLATATACNTAGAKQCTAIGTPVGVGLDIAPQDAAEVDTATMELCWNGTCRTHKVRLMPSSKSVAETCEGDGPDGVCAAKASPTGGKHGFAMAEGLPQTPVAVTLTLLDAKGKKLLSKRVDVTPKLDYPNGPDCGAGGPQAGLTVKDGRVAARG